jgi:hypothetical protein
MVRATGSPPGSRSSLEHREATSLPLSDDAIATVLEQTADLLQAQRADPVRVQTWRDAAVAVRALPRPAAAIAIERGEDGLRAVPGIVPAAARAICQLALTGRCTMHDRLSGTTGPFDVLATVSGIGPELAHRIHDLLGIDDLYELEIAAYDGRLIRVPGMGPGRLRTVRGSLASRFRRRPPLVAPPPEPAIEQPPVAELLDIDAEYRRRAAEDVLPRVEPRRASPRIEATLPVLHTQREGRHYTALYAYTVRASAPGGGDQVVLYRDDAGGRGQWTLATAHAGALRGRRVVCGREESTPRASAGEA